MNRGRDSTERLKLDPHFTPCPVEYNDELRPNGIFEFNITRMLDWIAANPDAIALVDLDVDDSSTAFSEINESHVDSVDISRPGILAEIAPGQYGLIDGNHRAEKARRLGVATIPAYRLSMRQHLPFLTSKRAYLAYVEYWNGKLR